MSCTLPALFVTHIYPVISFSSKSQASRPEQSVMQALESLTETQVRFHSNKVIPVDV